MWSLLLVLLLFVVAALLWGYGWQQVFKFLTWIDQKRP